jgi:hypothetical protein
MQKKFWLSLWLGVVLLSATPALAADNFYVVAGRPAVGTRITSLPCTITAPGYYYLVGNLSYSGTGDGITVDADNVTIDLMGFVLAGPGDTGISISNHNNIEIRNGTVKNWDNGIYEYGGSCIRVIGIRVNNNTGTDVYLFEGDDTLIQDCSAQSTGTAPGLYSLGNKGTIKGCIVVGGNAAISEGTASDNLVLNATRKDNEGITSIGPGTVSHNAAINSTIGISDFEGGSIVGNVVYTNSGQTGIEAAGPSPSMVNLLDQNTVSGTGTHYLAQNPNVWGVNAGK